MPYCLASTNTTKADGVPKRVSRVKKTNDFVFPNEFTEDLPKWAEIASAPPRHTLKIERVLKRRHTLRAESSPVADFLKLGQDAPVLNLWFHRPTPFLTRLRSKTGVARKDPLELAQDPHKQVLELARTSEP